MAITEFVVVFQGTEVMVYNPGQLPMVGALVSNLRRLRVEGPGLVSSNQQLYTAGEFSEWCSELESAGYKTELVRFA